jgi:UDP-N-acetylmuramate dehydrogenase
VTISSAHLQTLRNTFGIHMQENVSMKRYTAARIGGAADILITVGSSTELAEVVKMCWELNIHVTILGSGSNVLVSDAGVRQVVVLNHAKKIAFNPDLQPVTVWVESGATLGALARQAAARGLSGLEWAISIPGTVGGAIYGNAGAQGSDIAQNLVMANILHLSKIKGDHRHEILQEEWPVERFAYAYRSSSIKRQPGQVAILSAQLKLSQSIPEAVQAKMDEYRTVRQYSQPSGASLGSIFKNPTGDFAGRLIDAAGLKGKKMGKVEISQKHANFFINQGNAKANDYAGLIKLVQKDVYEKFGISLELEIELLGDWAAQ